MKKLIPFLFILILTASCKKETPPTLTGEWNLFMTFTSSAKSFSGPMTITQKSDNSLTGQWTISDGSGSSALTPISKVTGSNVTIGLIIGTYDVTFTGTVDESYDSMSGTFSSSGINVGPWSATRK